MLTSDLARLISQPVPRYTSYPTAPHFQPSVNGDAYGSWLEQLAPDATLSLYMHVPFCDTLCWFCGCHTRVTRRYEPVGFYLGGLMREIALVGARVPATSRVSHIHWGGGSPTMLSADDIRRLMEATRRSLAFADDADFAIEVDPRGLDEARMDALTASGLTRVSIGVQDFDPEVQWAINREQSFEETRQVVDAFRERGVRSLNIDAIYGLPHQTEARLMATLGRIVSLSPDRIALFGYAHVPWMKKHQEMIPPEALPDSAERFRQAENAARFLVAAGYRRIGIDHFALPTDSLTTASETGTLRRNFQGYTVDPADALIGFGASAIGSLPEGYVQNEAATGRYLAQIAEGRFATTRGLVLSPEDRLRRGVIEALMCDLRLDPATLAGLPGTADAKRAVELEMKDMTDEARRGWLVRENGGVRVTEAGRPFLRLIASRFDAYLARKAGRHSAAV